MDRFSHFSLAPGSPKTLEPGNVSSLPFDWTPEQDAVSCCVPASLSGRTRSWAIRAGSRWNASSAGRMIESTVRRVNLTTPQAAEALAMDGEVGTSGEIESSKAKSIDFAFTIPAGATYAVVDLDLFVLTGSGGKAGASHGLSPKEVVILGPDQLAATRDFVAKVALSGGSTGTFRITATAYT